MWCILFAQKITFSTSVRRNGCLIVIPQLATLLFTTGCGTGSFPSNCSTFLATLNMIPMAAQVKRKEVPPILIYGSVTPVTGVRFTFTAMFAIAWIANVKLSPSAKNAPNANGHRLNMLMLLNKNSR